MITGKTRSNGPNNGLPPGLAAAITVAEDGLARCGKLADTLAETVDTVSKALAQERQSEIDLGVTEISGGDVGSIRTELTATRDRRESAARRRRAAITGLLELEGELAVARAGVDAAKTEYADDVLANFHSRWKTACHVLATLHAEATLLSTALHTTVTCPPPYTVSMNIVRDCPELRFAGVPVPPLPLPGELALLTNTLDRLTSAGRLIGAIQAAAQMDERHHALSRVRTGMQDQMLGVFLVIKPFSYFDFEFELGMLVDRSLLNDGLLHRLLLGKNVRIADPTAAVAAA